MNLCPPGAWAGVSVQAQGQVLHDVQRKFFTAHLTLSLLGIWAALGFPAPALTQMPGVHEYGMMEHVAAPQVPSLCWAPTFSLANPTAADTCAPHVLRKRNRAAPEAGPQKRPPRLMNLWTSCPSVLK